MNQINTDKECVRLYSFSKTFGHTTAEVFLQADDNGYIRYYPSRQVGGKASTVAYGVKVKEREVRELLRIAIDRGAK
jgi:phosphatidate phosphatase PAH1